MAETASRVAITGQDTAVDPRPDAGTPIGLNVISAGANGQVKGTNGDDRATLATILADKDQLIKLGEGDDVFIFRNNNEGVSTRINGVLSGGEGNDRVFLGGELSDYLFSIRSDGGLKIQRVIDGPGEDGAAVTFYSFEEFTFRGIRDDGTNTVDQVFSYDALRALILNPTGDSVEM